MAGFHIREESFAWNQRRRLGGARSGSDLERVIMFSFILIFCGALVTGIFSTVLYASQLSEVSNVRTSQCLVLSYEIIPYTESGDTQSGAKPCYREVCKNQPSGPPVCDFEPTNCFVAQWVVQYSQVDPEGESIRASGIRSYVVDPPVSLATAAQKKLESYQVSNSYKCSYSADQPYRVWWGHPGTDTWLITMIVSWGVVALFLCALGFGWFFSKPIET